MLEIKVHINSQFLHNHPFCVASFAALHSQFIASRRCHVGVVIDSFQQPRKADQRWLVQ
jgi:hypothetical protein